MRKLFAQLLVFCLLFSVPLHALSLYGISLYPVYYLSYTALSAHFRYLEYQKRCQLQNALICGDSKSHFADGVSVLDGDCNSTQLLNRSD